MTEDLKMKIAGGHKAEAMKEDVNWERQEKCSSWFTVYAQSEWSAWKFPEK